MKPALLAAALAVLALAACDRNKTVNVTRDVTEPQRTVVEPQKTVVIHDDHHPDPYHHDDHR